MTAEDAKARKKRFTAATQRRGERQLSEMKDKIKRFRSLRVCGGVKWPAEEAEIAEKTLTYAENPGATSDASRVRCEE